MKQKKPRTFSATSLNPTTTPIGQVKAPIVYYTQEAWYTLSKYVELCSGEVGWLGTVDVLESGDYLIDKVYLLEQTVTGATTDIESDAVANLAVSLEEQGIDSSRLRYWGHSHVNMQVSPSGTDEDQLQEYLDNGCNYFIRGIYNKKGDAKVDVFDQDKGVVFQACQNKLQIDGFGDEWVAQIKAEIKDKVKAPVYNNYKGKPHYKYGKSDTVKTSNAGLRYGDWYYNSVDYEDDNFTYAKGDQHKWDF